MSNPNIDSDGFRLVCSKRKKERKKNQTNIHTKATSTTESDTVIDITKSRRRIIAAVEDLKDSTYLESILKSVSTVLESKPVVEIVSLGLGSVGECNISRYQLALLLCLKELLDPKAVLVHDPIFSKEECALLQQFGLKVIKENKEGNYIISETGVSICYFPHCPKQLTNNFLWCNWGPVLHNCILICNSFSTLFEHHLERIIAETVPYIYKIYPYTTEVVLNNNFKYTDVFNDTSIHIFLKDNLEKLGAEFWVKDSQPKYEDTEEFITSLVVEKLNI